MPETRAITVYRLDELPDGAKERARDWYRQTAFDYPWYDFVYQDFETVCDLLGLRLKTSPARLYGGGTRQKPSIYFRGFWSQGDGACFEGQYRYRPGVAKMIRAHAPTYLELHQIADTLLEVQRRNFYQLTASAIHRGHYYHEYCMVLDVDRDSLANQDMTADAEEGVKEALRDLARWLYRELEREFKYLNSDSAIDEAVEANACRFTADGTLSTN